MKQVGAVIMAAGAGIRMGRQKLLLPLGGRPLLDYVLSAVAALPLADAVAVIGEPQEKLADLCHRHGIRSVYNPARETGQASSITLGLETMAPDLDGILFLTGDQPFLPAVLLDRLLQHFTELDDNRCIVLPGCNGENRGPVLFGAYWYPDLKALTGDGGGRSIVRRRPQQVHTVAWDDESAFWDADTWDDYQQLVKYEKEMRHVQHTD